MFKGKKKQRTSGIFLPLLCSFFSLTLGECLPAFIIIVSSASLPESDPPVWILSPAFGALSLTYRVGLLLLVFLCDLRMHFQHLTHVMRRHLVGGVQALHTHSVRVVVEFEQLQGRPLPVNYSPFPPHIES